MSVAVPAGWQPSVIPPGDAWLKILIYGQPGVGKTSLAASSSLVETMSPVLFVSAECGHLAISEDVPELVDAGRITATPFQGFGELDVLLAWLERGDHTYKTIVFDSLSDVQESMAQMWSDRLAPNAPGGLPDVVEEEKVTLRVIKHTTNGLRERLRAMRDLPMHVIWVAAEADTASDPNSRAFSRFPALYPKLRMSAIGYVDVVARLYIAAGEAGGPDATRLLLCWPTADTVAKDRSPAGKLGRLIKEPTMQKIWSAITRKG